jgi:hypothetical protein
VRSVTPNSVSDSAFRFPAVHRLGNKVANYLKGRRLTQKTGYKSWNIHNMKILGKVHAIRHKIKRKIGRQEAEFRQCFGSESGLDPEGQK